MAEPLRFIILLVLAGIFVAFAGSALAWWRDEERRMRRMLARALGGKPDMVLIAHGYGRGAGFRVQDGQVAVLRDGGLKGLVYRLDQIMGAELVVDDRVTARAFRGETRRALDETPANAQKVVLRLVFDSPTDPDFELPLWPPLERSRTSPATAAAALKDSRRWLSSVEAIHRHPAAVRAAVTEGVRDAAFDAAIGAGALLMVDNQNSHLYDDLNLGEDPEGPDDLFDP